MSRYDVFCSHYFYHLVRRRGQRLKERPTLGELAMTSQLTRATCRRFRYQLEDNLEPLMVALQNRS